MTDTRNTDPQMPHEDQVLDQYLASLGRFSPAPGFQDRVMARVRISTPVPARSEGLAAPPVRKRRWPVLVGSLSGIAALSSTALTAWAALNVGAMTAWASAALAAVGLPAWHAALTWLAGASASAGSALMAGAYTAGYLPLLWTFVILNLAVPVSALGLFLVARPSMRMRSHAAR